MQVSGVLVGSGEVVSRVGARTLKVILAQGGLGALHEHRVIALGVRRPSSGPRRESMLMLEYSNRVTFQAGLGLV